MHIISIYRHVYRQKERKRWREVGGEGRMRERKREGERGGRERQRAGQGVLGCLIL